MIDDILNILQADSGESCRESPMNSYYTYTSYFIQNIIILLQFVSLFNKKME